MMNKLTSAIIRSFIHSSVYLLKVEIIDLKDACFPEEFIVEPQIDYPWHHILSLLYFSLHLKVSKYIRWLL